MPYTKQGFLDGQVLGATNVIRIEDGIIEAQDMADDALTQLEDIDVTVQEAKEAIAESAEQTAEAKQATEDALTAISAIYHDKRFILNLNESDLSLTLTYNDEV